MPTQKITPNSLIPTMSFAKVDGGELTFGGTRDNWSMLVVYRGKHCPRCKKYLNILNDMLGKWSDAEIDVSVGLEV